jgi:hypothetical protein
VVTTGTGATSAGFGAPAAAGVAESPSALAQADTVAEMGLKSNALRFEVSLFFIVQV